MFEVRAPEHWTPLFEAMCIFFFVERKRKRRGKEEGRREREREKEKRGEERRKGTLPEGR